MSKKQLSAAAIISALFGKSNKVISEKLSSEEFTDFTAEVTELNTRLDAQTAANELVVADLATANASVTELTTNLGTANTQLTAVTSERDKYKAHYDKSADKGNNEGGEDDNSRKTEIADYNLNAVDVWKKSHQKD